MKYIRFIAVLFPIVTTCWVLRDAPQPAWLTSGDNTIARFPWSDMAEQTGFDPEEIMSNFNFSQTLPFTCTEVRLLSTQARTHPADKILHREEARI